MYHKSYIYLLIIIFTVLGKVNFANPKAQSNFLFQPIKSQQFDNSEFFLSRIILRIDHIGEYRSYKSNFYYKIDSLIYLEVFTNLGSKVLSFQATQKEIMLSNISEKTTYIVDYSYLSSMVGFYIDFEILKIVINGFNDHNNKFLDLAPMQIAQFQLITKTILNSVSVSYFLNTNRIKEFLISKNPNLPLFEAQYNWNDSFSLRHPQNISFILFYGENELELEFDCKQIVNKSNLNTFTETLQNVVYLTETE